MRKFKVIKIKKKRRKKLIVPKILILKNVLTVSNDLKMKN
jgi:hypothetical protein